eukprot:5410841-Pyramimonas_sp.AAC.1
MFEYSDPENQGEEATESFHAIAIPGLFDEGVLHVGAEPEPYGAHESAPAAPLPRGTISAPARFDTEECTVAQAAQESEGADEETTLTWKKQR